jgi:alpha-ribazole phosphatase
MEIILIRHTSVDVPPGTCYGQTDVPLKPTFEEEALITKEKLKAYGHFDCVYTSPLSRCTRLAKFCGYPNANRDTRILELNFGAWEMQNYDHITDPRLQEWFDDYLNIAATGGESFAMQYERVALFLEELRTKPFHKVAVFTHGGVLICAQIYAGLLKREDAFKHTTPYGGIISIKIKTVQQPPSLPLPTD